MYIVRVVYAMRKGMVFYKYEERSYSEKVNSEENLINN